MRVVKNTGFLTTLIVISSFSLYIIISANRCPLLGIGLPEGYRVHQVIRAPCEGRIHVALSSRTLNHFTKGLYHYNNSPIVCCSSWLRDLASWEWNCTISPPSSAPNFPRTSLCQASYFSATLLWTRAKSMTTGPYSRRVSDVSNVVRDFLMSLRHLIHKVMSSPRRPYRLSGWRSHRAW